jgi:hypothetical protein
LDIIPIGTCTTPSTAYVYIKKRKNVEERIMIPYDQLEKRLETKAIR